MSIKVMSWVWDNGPTAAVDRLVLLALADFCDDQGKCWPSMDRIGEKACMTGRGARNVIRRLEEEGWISVAVGGGRGGCSTYQIIMQKEEHRSRNEIPGTEYPEPENPERGDIKPGTPRPKTRNAGSAEPSLNHQEPSLSAQAAPARVLRFEEFWNAYPHRNGTKKGRKPAEAKYRAAVKRGVPEQAIIDGARAAWRHPDVLRGFARDPTTWLNQAGWEDSVTTHPPPTADPKRAAHLDRLRRITASYQPAKPGGLT